MTNCFPEPISCRCLKLKRLVLPSCFAISDTGIYESFRCWKDLVSLTISPNNTNFPYLLEQISSNCKNFSELKLMGTCHHGFASTLVAYLPKLKVLSLRCTKFTSSDLHTVLDDLKQLQVLNISHCFWIKINWIILDKASRLQSFITCMQSDRCIVCRVCYQRDKEDRWHEDEVDSLALNRWIVTMKLIMLRFQFKWDGLFLLNINLWKIIVFSGLLIIWVFLLG